MSTLSLRLPTELPEKAAAAPRPGFWRRVFDAMVEAQMRKAEREVRQYRHLVPTDEVRKAGYRVGLKESGVLPFAGRV